jgi:hypothetical protein
MSFDSNVSTYNLSDSIDLYLSISERLLADISMPPDFEGKSVGMSVTDFCIREVERASVDQHDRFKVNSTIAKLSVYGCDGSHLLAHLLAAKYDEKLSRYADILLDDIRQSDADLVFRINKFTDRSHAIHTLCMDPIGFASLDGYIDFITERGYRPSHGQKFGIEATKLPPVL